MKLLRSNKLRMLRGFFRTEKGFTLIELLVVIGILGILAAGLLATIDPLEQFRKGSDSNETTTSLELVNALTRYYAIHSTFPWDTVADGGSACGSGVPAPGSWTTGYQVSLVGANSAFNSGTVGCLDELVKEGELKNSFPTQYGILNKLWVVDTTASNSTSKSVTVCFHPDSKSEQAKATTNWTSPQTGIPTQTCTAGSGSACYECTQ